MRLALLAMLVSASLVSVAAQQARIVIDSKAVPQTGNIVQLVVNRDDSILEILKSGGKESTIAKLGARVLTSGLLDLRKFLPKGTVAAAARRKTLDDGSVAHAIMVVGFFGDQHAELSCRIYLFRETLSRVERTLDENVGDTCGQLSLDDSINEGMILVIAGGREGNYDTLQIYEMSCKGGSIREIHRMQNYEVKYFEGTDISTPSIFAADEVKDSRCAEMLLCFKPFGSSWSKKTKKFEPDKSN